MRRTALALGLFLLPAAVFAQPKPDLYVVHEEVVPPGMMMRYEALTTEMLGTLAAKNAMTTHVAHQARGARLLPLAVRLPEAGEGVGGRADLPGLRRALQVEERPRRLHDLHGHDGAGSAAARRRDPGQEPRRLRRHRRAQHGAPRQRPARAAGAGPRHHAPIRDARGVVSARSVVSVAREGRGQMTLC